MGLVYARIQLSNDLRPDLAGVEVEALVDSGAINLCIPEALKDQLGLKIRRKRVAEMADGSTLEVDVVSPVTVEFENRFTVTTAMVVGNEVLLGAIPMQDLDVLIDPRNERVILPPDRPNFALSKLKGMTKAAVDGADIAVPAGATVLQECELQGARPSPQPNGSPFDGSSGRRLVR